LIATGYYRRITFHAIFIIAISLLRFRLAGSPPAGITLVSFIVGYVIEAFIVPADGRHAPDYLFNIFTTLILFSSASHFFNANAWYAGIEVAAVTGVTPRQTALMPSSFSHTSLACH